jgi:hypothetical protein
MLTLQTSTTYIAFLCRHVMYIYHLNLEKALVGWIKFSPDPFVSY